MATNAGKSPCREFHALSSVCLHSALAMKIHTDRQVRWQSWAVGAMLFIGYCFLRVLTLKLAPIHQALEIRSSVAIKLALVHGSILFPLLGILAAAMLVLSDLLLQGRTVQWTLIALFTGFGLWTFQALAFSVFTISSAIQANQSWQPRPVGHQACSRAPASRPGCTRRSAESAL